MAILKILTLLYAFASTESSLAVTAVRADMTGRAIVIEGDVLSINGEHVRLFGIDAPETGQSCKDENGLTYNCGERAAQALVERIGQDPVTCVELDRDRGDRVIARCSTDDGDLGEWMVLNGWAVAYTYVNYEYTRAEYRAKRAQRGIWAGRFVKPWQWREGRRLD